MVAGGVGVDWPLWVRCSLSDVRRWCLAVLWLGCGCDVVAVAGVPGMDPPARLLSLDVGLWPLVGGDKRARLGCRGCHRRGSLPGVSVEISTVAAALTVCQRSPCRLGDVVAVLSWYGLAVVGALLPVRCAPLVCGWVVAVMWWPWPVCLVWIHRRGCDVVAAGWWWPWW